MANPDSDNPDSDAGALRSGGQPLIRELFIGRLEALLYFGWERPALMSIILPSMILPAVVVDGQYLLIDENAKAK